MTIKCKRLITEAVIPDRAHPGDAGLDLWSTRSILLGAAETKVMETGLALSIPGGYFGMIRDLSWMATRGIHVMGGIIDSGYRGEIKIILHNTNPSGSARIDSGTAVAQLLILPVPDVEIVEVEELSKTERGLKGFGGSDRKELRKCLNK